MRQGTPVLKFPKIKLQCHQPNRVPYITATCRQPRLLTY